MKKRSIIILVFSLFIFSCSSEIHEINNNHQGYTLNEHIKIKQSYETLDNPRSDFYKESVIELQLKIENKYPYFKCEELVDHPNMIKECYNYILSNYNFFQGKLNFRACYERYDSNESIFNCVIKSDQFFYEDNICEKLYPKCYEVNFRGSPISYLLHYWRDEEYNSYNCLNIEDKEQRYNCFYYSSIFDFRKNDRQICSKFDETGFYEQCNKDIDEMLLRIVEYPYRLTMEYRLSFDRSENFLFNTNDDFSYLCDYIKSYEKKEKCYIHINHLDEINSKIDKIDINSPNALLECNNLFQDDFSLFYCDKKIDILQQKQRINKLKETNELKESAILFCKQKCAEAANNRCSRASLGNLCLSYGSNIISSPNWIDLNMNGVKDLDLTLMNGIGVCEEEIPCFALIDTCCNQPINPRTCLDILINYWVDDLGKDSEFVSKTIKSTMKFGTSETCNPGSEVIMWYDLTGNLNSDVSYALYASAAS